MNRITANVSLILIVLIAAVPRSESVRRVVVTFDDLPFQAAASSDYITDGGRVIDRIVGTLARHTAPAVGFVNEGQLHVAGEMDRRIALLQRWADGGVVLGNHTYSHVDLNAVTVEQFEDEIVRGDVITRRVMEPHRPYQLYFRHPFTHTGDTAKKKSAVERFLAERGYRITPHTLDNADWAYNVPYVRARRNGDEAMQAKLVQSYLELTSGEIEFVERIAPRIFGREVPQTLLLHANDMTADLLDSVLRAFEQRGYTFITLDEAMADPAYQTPDTYVTRSGPSWLWRWTKSQGLNLTFKDEPEAPAWVMDLYREGSAARTCACPPGAAVCPPDLSEAQSRWVAMR